MERQRTFVLISPGLAWDADRALDVAAWTGRSGYRIVVLPPPWYYAAPTADANERKRLGRRYVTDLEKFFQQLQRGRVIAFVIAEEDVSGQMGHAWLQRVTEAAHQAQVQLPRSVRVSRNRRLDRERLEQYISDWGD